MKRLTSFSTSGRLIDGQVILDNSLYYKGMLKSFDDEKHVRITVERARGGKTQAQLGYLYGHLYEVISAHTGYTVQEVDDVMKAKFLRSKLMWRGAELVTVRSKADLTSDEMGEFIQSVFEECLALGLKVEPPDKEWRVKRDF